MHQTGKRKSLHETVWYADSNTSRNIRSAVLTNATATFPSQILSHKRRIYGNVLNAAEPRRESYQMFIAFCWSIIYIIITLAERNYGFPSKT